MGVSRQVRVVAGRKVTVTVVVQESNWRLVEVGRRGWIPAGGCWLMNSFLFLLPPGARGQLRGKKSVYSADSSKASGVGQALCKAPGAWG